jgi:hypothetical protein
MAASREVDTTMTNAAAISNAGKAGGVKPPI